MPYDPECYDLAHHFLPSGIDPRVRDELAQLIQTTIEDFLHFGEHAAKIAELEATEGR